MSTGKLLPEQPAKAKELYDAFASLSGNAAFKCIKERIAERLAKVDEANRHKGQENVYTEAQAWEWFLDTAEEATAKGERLTMDLEVLRTQARR